MKSQNNIKVNKKKRKVHTMKKKKPAELAAMSMDDFMMNGFETDESEKESNINVTKNSQLKTTKKKSNVVLDGSISDSDDENKETDDVLEDEEYDDGSEIEESDKGSKGNSEVEGNDDSLDEDEVKDLNDQNSASKVIGKDSKDDEGDWTSENFSHKKAMAKLKNSDPEFYKFLQENDMNLLNFKDSDSETDTQNVEAGGKFHKPPESLEVASDESDYEEAEVVSGSRTITLKMVQKWETDLQHTAKSGKAIIEVIHAFHAAVVRVSNNDADESAKYVVTGSAVFNAVIQLCVLELQPALKKYLRISESKHVDPTKNKVHWSKVKRIIRFYLNNLMKLLGGVTSPDILAVLLKHLHQMMPFVTSFPLLCKPLLKILVSLWSRGEDTVRIVAFLCLLRLNTHQKNKYLDRVLKKMYLAFIRNCKFVSPSTKSAINFMRRSLVEMFALDLNISYQHAFLYIRQLAIHLRNAITLHKQEHIQAVCNWQFVNSIHLWADLLGATVHKPQLQPLLYPLVQVVIGVLQLVSSAQYFPMRFHCTQILIQLSKATCTFIPILPFLLEVLKIYDFNKRHKKVSMKPKIFTFSIRASKSEMEENGFKDVVIDTVYKQILEYLTNESHSISFPDLVIPTVMQIRPFLKTCKNINYQRKIKQLRDKIIENSEMVEKERQKVNFKLSDQKSIAAWETQLKLKGTPLSKFFESWSRVHAQNEAKKYTQNDEIGDFNLPVLKKRPREDKPISNEPVVLFPSDDSGSEADILKPEDREREPVKKRGKRAGRKCKKTLKTTSINNKLERNFRETNIDNGDIVEDLKLEDFQ